MGEPFEYKPGDRVVLNGKWTGDPTGWPKGVECEMVGPGEHDTSRFIKRISDGVAKEFHVDYFDFVFRPKPTSYLLLTPRRKLAL